MRKDPVREAAWAIVRRENMEVRTSHPHAYRWASEYVDSEPQEPVAPQPMGTPLGPPRLCPACKEMHPPGTTCEGGWAPWRPEDA